MFEREKDLFGATVCENTIKTFVIPDNFKNMEQSHRDQLKAFIDTIKTGLQKW